ncbi:MAG: class I mannose-6-phosphate isomerase [Erysipelotrichaceae bacterium]|nr:class I mannose-6-phosphate isomerase [Erysipelotrichaceae bacterium]
MKEYRMIRLMPALKEFLWGGSRLKEEFGKNCDLDAVAESWELSVHPSGPSTVVETGQLLADYLAERPGYLGEDRNCLDILIKFIDARDNLSLQVHPDEAYAQQHEHQHGKTEMWYIIDAAEGAGIIYGMKDEMSREEFRSAIENNTILEHVNFVPVRKGDYCLIRAGTLHAIGKGCLIAEIQQSSDVTYRVYDYDRRDKYGNPRQLHIDRAVEVTDLKPVITSVDNVEGQRTLMTDNELFTVSYAPLGERISIETSPLSFTAVIFTDGQGTISYRDQQLTYRKGDSWLVPAGNDLIEIEGSGECLYVTVK